MLIGQERTREDGQSLSEIALVERLCSDQRVMVDVGAHYGGSAAGFLRRGWKVIAFEPDPHNRQHLAERLGDSPALVIDPRAVSDQPAEKRPFYASDVSTGISGLHSFHETHHQVAAVEVTTLAQALAEHGVFHVNFLKIDTEGHDLPVLRGLDWQRIVPDVILCEFEDSKSQPLGYAYHDMAGFLVDKGYTVYVSEWYPIIAYGQQHTWRRLMRYPAELATADAWGNLVAFQEPPPETAIADVLNSLLNIPPAPPAVSDESTIAAPPREQRAQSRLKAMAHYYSRWPGLVALAIVVLSALAATDSALAPLFAGLGALLLLFLFGHMATRIRGG